MKRIMLSLLVIGILILTGCTSKSSIIAAGECPLGEPDCKDVVVNPPIDGNEKDVLPGCVGDDCTIPPATKNRNISKPPASETNGVSVNVTDWKTGSCAYAGFVCDNAINSCSKKVMVGSCDPENPSANYPFEYKTLEDCNSNCN